jgi:hypothetical protein
LQSEANIRKRKAEMIDIFGEDLIDFRTAAREKVFRHPKTGHPAHISSIYRYVLRGGRASNGERVQLEVVKTPSGLRTSREAIQRFIGAMSNPTAPPALLKSRAKEITRAESELLKDGFSIGG